MHYLHFYLYCDLIKSDGIQEVCGLISLISTKNLGFLAFMVCRVGFSSIFAKRQMLTCALDFRLKIRNQELKNTDIMAKIKLGVSATIEETFCDFNISTHAQKQTGSLLMEAAQHKYHIIQDGHLSIRILSDICLIFLWNIPS